MASMPNVVYPESPGPMLPASHTGDEITLSAVISVVRRRRRLLLGPILACCCAAGLSWLLATPRYRATAVVQVEKEDGGTFGLESTVDGSAGGAVSSDALDYSLTLQTEAALLRSPSLALSVIKVAHLEADPDYFEAHAGAGGAAWLHPLRLFAPAGHRIEPLSIPLDQAPNRRALALKVFAGHLKVAPVIGTRLIEISYADPDPARAALVANDLTRALRDKVFQQRFSETMQGSAWLSAQLGTLRTRTEQAQAQADALQKGTGIFGSDPSSSSNIVLQRLDSLNQTLTSAESNRILKESIDHVAQTASPELISSLSGNSSTGAVASINTSLSLIQGLRQQQAQIRADLAAARVRYGAAYPKVTELDAELNGVMQSIAAETERLGQRAHSDFLVAKAQENAARSAFDQQKQVAAQQNNAVIRYELARQEANSSRDLYENLLAKLQQASLLEGLRANNISIVSPAQPPAPAQPASPNLLLREGLALLAGLLLGLAAVVSAEMRDVSIHSPEEVESFLGIPLLAVLPEIERRVRVAAHAGPQSGLPPGNASEELIGGRMPTPLTVLDRQASAFGEGMRSLRTALLLSRGGAPPQVILVTSSVAGEGKSTLAANLATLFAQNGSRTLLVDADMRKPALHRYAQGYREDASFPGLASALTSSGPIPVHRPVATLPNLAMLCGSERPPFPSELLGSPRMHALMKQWRTDYDVIILDSPPALPVTDAALLARHSDAALLVARCGSTSRQALRRTLRALSPAGCAQVPIGVVVNAVSRSSPGFLEYFGYEGELYATEAS
jgi:succinoglycan biosynthesis transport protein ExoP